MMTPQDRVNLWSSIHFQPYILPAGIAPILSLYKTGHIELDKMEMVTQGIHVITHESTITDEFMLEPERYIE